METAPALAHSDSGSSRFHCVPCARAEAAAASAIVCCGSGSEHAVTTRQGSDGASGRRAGATVRGINDAGEGRLGLYQLSLTLLLPHPLELRAPDSQASHTSQLLVTNG